MRANDDRWKLYKKLKLGGYLLIKFKAIAIHFWTTA